MGKKGILFFLIIMMLLGMMPSLAGAQGGDTEKPYWWEKLAFVWPTTSEGSLVYDPISNRVIALFHEGGEARNYITYAWDGTQWTNLGYVEPNGDLSSARLVYSPKAGKILLYGGMIKWNGTTPKIESAIWQMDEQGWTQVTPSVYSPIPPARYDEAVATDPSGGLLLFGGKSGDILQNETWVWDPVTQMWTDKTDPDGNNPPARAVASMVYDPGSGNVLLFGGFSTKQYWYSPYENPLGDTWLWDGTSWRDVTGEVYGPSPRAGAAMSYDPKSGKIYLFGGEDSNGDFLNDLWAWDGKERKWTLVAENVGDLTGRAEAFFTEGPDGNLLLFGGKYSLNDLWKYDSVSDLWEEIIPPSPSNRSNAAIATNEQDGTVLLFGGDGIGEPYGDTWVWDGSRWTRLKPQHSPPDRRIATMAYDGRHIILFGGYDDNGYNLDDTWLWTGQDWEQVPTDEGPTPPVRNGASMAYFPSKGQVIMFGGWGNDGALGDTWIWNGQSWTQFNQPDGLPTPSPRDGASLAFDGKELLLFGGNTDNGESDETWLFDGEKWSQITTGPFPPARSGGTLAYDRSTGKTYLFGGTDSNGNSLNDLWMWDPETQTWNLIDPGSPPPEWPSAFNLQTEPAHLDPAPSSRDGHMFSYSPNNRGMILFGGFNRFFENQFQDTWILHTSDWLKLERLTLSADKFILQTRETTRVTGRVYGKDGLGLSDIPVTLEVYDGGGGLGTANSVTQVVYSDENGKYSTTYTAPDTAGSVTIRAYIEGTNLSDSVTLNVQEVPDSGGNPPPPSSVPDHTPPTGSIKINDGADWTDTCEVNLTLTASDIGSGVKEMRFSQDGERWSEWEPYATMKLYAITPVAGLKQVYVQFRDYAGNVSEPVSDEIFSRGCCHQKPANPPQFTDISSHWAEQEIKLGAAEGLAIGYPDGTFRPDRNVTRAEFVVMLARAFCLPEGTIELPFTDTDQIPDWARKEVSRAYEAGWIEGYPDNTFRSDRTITRSEVAAILVRALKLTPKQEVDLTTFADYAEVAEWAKEYLYVAYANGLMNGRSDHRLVPNGNATRAETLILLLRELGYIETK